MRQLKLCFIVVVIYAFAFILFSLAFSKEKSIHGKLFYSSKAAQDAATFGMETLAQISSKLFESRQAHSALKEKIVFPFMENLTTKPEASGLEADMKCVEMFYYRALTLKSTHMQYKTSLLKANHERYTYTGSLHRTFFEGPGSVAPLLDETEIPVEFYDAERFVRNKIKRAAEGMLGGPEFQDYGGYCILEFPDKALYLDGRRKDFQIPHASASSILHCPNDKRYHTEADNGYDPKLAFERLKQVGNALNTLYSLGISVLFQLDEFSCSFPYSEVEQMYNQLDNVTDFEYLVGYVPLVKKRSRQEKISVFQRITSYLWQRRKFDKQERQHEARAASPDVLTFNYIVFEPLDMNTGTEFICFGL
ncbi:hypothetical protein MP638_002299 [Amoeboaphelidium occidentale]|nr:hypothetical protein MP638_002299 [Amoeboaphelidium occidentale]